jgi:hypothetical protein
MQQVQNREWMLAGGVSIMALAANMPPAIQASIGVDRTILVVALGVILSILLLRHSRAMLIVAVGALFSGANLPDTVASQLHVNPNILLAALIALVIVVVINRFLNVLPTGEKTTYKTEHGLRMLGQAISAGRLNLIQTLVDANVDLNAAIPSGELVLNRAVASGNFEVVQMLVENGARVNGSDASGKPLDLARKMGHRRIAAYLKAKGAW